MENNVPIIAKKVWSMVRVVLFMLRKGISKGKLTMDLNMILKRRGKLAGKAITNLMSHHHHGGCSTTSRHDSTLQFSTQREYEFSCSNTPNYFFSIGGKRHNRNQNHNHLFMCAHAPPTIEDDAVTMNEVKAVLEMLNNNNSEVMVESSYSTPALPGFGKSPMVRQLRVAESPLLLGGADNMVDKKAEEFIKRFYKELRKQD
ncbi:PREDICTED: uncharacterized protein LOC109342874 isoform X1 [Lupinus angustifolius]|uniref:uncharacterized protein LOC109342874 isoform X1 n=1 Tax=Lupinus angustifolius TaxID=3871 RepID=UPI00092EFA1D|nr:PREDICTED: uncharacterized protein LOC109342874 isoform X1 [Lupinus angustifolius]